METNRSQIPNAAPSRIVCAANKHTDGAIVIGVRHYCPVMREAIDIRNKDLSYFDYEDWSDSDQGFIDQFGDFYDRQTAWLIACKANQIFRLVGGQTKEDLLRTDVELYSENLY